MDIVEKLLKNNPCGQTLGHGDSCQPGWECQSCNDRQQAASEITSLRQQLAEQTSSEPDELLDMPFVTDEQKFRFWQAAKKEVKALRHDIDSYMTIANEYANSNQSVEVLVEALRSFVNAGYGNSTDFYKQAEAHGIACQLIATYSKPITAEEK